MHSLGITRGNHSGLSIKENFENHPVVWGLSLVTLGFVAGFGARAYVLPIATSELQCTVEGLASLEESHNSQMNTLNGQLIQLEAKAAAHDLISSYQEKYREAADRIRTDIERATRTYLAAMESLSKKCR